MLNPDESTQSGAPLRYCGNASSHERVVLCHSSMWSRMSPGLIPMGIGPFLLVKRRYTSGDESLRTVIFEFASVDELLGHMGETSALVWMIIATSSPEAQAEFWEQLAEAAVSFTDADGIVCLSNECLVAAGQR